jgi:hypothetical protein
LHFYLTDEAQTKSQHSIRVDLSSEARIRYPDAEVRSRRVFMSGSDASPSSGPTVVTHQTAPADPAPAYDSGSQSAPRRRVAVNEDSSGPVINTVETPETPTDAPAQPQPATPSAQPKGWPRAAPNTSNPN